MFISTLELFKIGIGPSSSHTMGPMLAAQAFREAAGHHLRGHPAKGATHIRCTLRGSLAHTGHGHASDRAILFGLHGYDPQSVADTDMEALFAELAAARALRGVAAESVGFELPRDLVFDRGPPLPQHPNGMIFELRDAAGHTLLERTWFSIGGGFIVDAQGIGDLQAPLPPGEENAATCPYDFANAHEMLEQAARHDLGIAEMKRRNETACRQMADLDAALDRIAEAMFRCIRNGLSESGELPGGLGLRRRAARLHQRLQDDPAHASVNDWLCAWAMAVNEENAAGHMVVTAPTNGAAGVVPAVLYELVRAEKAGPEQVRDFLLTAAAIGGLIKHNSSISGAEVGCQGEVGSASAMAAAGLCAARGGTPGEIEKAAEIALEHHLGMTCDPVDGLVQIPCIERNGFGAIKAWTSASLARLEGEGHHMPLDACIDAMRRTGEEMSHKYKETSLGGLAVSITEC